MDDYRSTLERELERLSPPKLPIDQLRRRRDRKGRDQRIRAGVLGLAIAIAVAGWGTDALRSSPVPAVPPEPPTADLGIFAPVAGGIVYGDRHGIWGVDPTAPPEQAAPVQVTSNPATPLGWTSDGTELLIMRQSPRANGDLLELLFILHADGSETPITTNRMDVNGATISPDGSRVVFAAQDGPGCCGPMALYAVDVGTGSLEVIPGSHNGSVSDPTFSPDGTQIAFVDGSGDHSHHVWVVNADGSDAHEIVFNETTAAAGHVEGLAWSPAGDRIALGIDVSGISTFAPDGSGFTEVIGRGILPHWSPDGSEIAYTIGWPVSVQGALAIADADGSNDRAFDFGAAGPWHPGQSTATGPAQADPTVAPQESSADLGIFADVRGWIAYGDVFGDVSGIWAMDPANPDAEPTPLDPDDGYPVDWSSDGSKLLVLRGWTGPLVVLNADGTETFLADSQEIRGASFTPDGSRVVYADNEGNRGAGIYIVDAHGGPAQLLHGSDRSVFFPAVSPDGKIAHFEGNGDRGNRLWVMNADGTDRHEIVGEEEGFMQNSTFPLTWSPDGARLAFVQYDGLYVLNPDGSEVSRIATGVTDAGAGSGPYWSPDGSRIAFTTGPGGKASLATVGLDGTQLSDLGIGRAGAWNPLDPAGNVVSSSAPA